MVQEREEKKVAEEETEQIIADIQEKEVKMPIYQAYNRRIKAWVKYHFTKKGFEVTDVKQRNPKKPFKGIKIKGKRK